MQDGNLMFGEAEDLSQNTGNYLFQKSIDLGTAGTGPVGVDAPFDVGAGTPLYVEARVITAFTSANSTATCQLQLVMADDEALGTNLVVLQETAAIVVTALTAGYRFALGALPPGITKRFLGLRGVIGTQTTTAGTVTAGLQSQSNTSPT